jgi:hypothetical protein
VFSVVIGLLMHLIFRNEESARVAAAPVMQDVEPRRPLWQNALFLAGMVGVLVFANWGKPVNPAGVWASLYEAKWFVTSAFAAALGIMLVRWLGAPWWKVLLAVAAVLLSVLSLPGEPMIAFAVGAVGLAAITATGDAESSEWFSASWGFAKQILPLLLAGVLVSGLLLGRVGHEGLIPSGWVSGSVGGNSLWANFFSSVVAAFMYFATLTEVPIMQGLIGNGMGKGPALALLLAGPALSLPSMLVLNGIMGTKKTVVYCSLVVILSTITGWVFGALFG